MGCYMVDWLCRTLVSTGPNFLANGDREDGHRQLVHQIAGRIPTLYLDSTPPHDEKGNYLISMAPGVTPVFVCPNNHHRSNQNPIAHMCRSKKATNRAFMSSKKGTS